jgi:hypothetical protein
MTRRDPKWSENVTRHHIALKSYCEPDALRAIIQAIPTSMRLLNNSLLHWAIVVGAHG